MSQPDRSIERIENFVADRQIVRCEPAAYPAILQVGMEAMGEFVVLAGVADEAGIVLDGLVQKRRQVINQVVRQADAAKKRERQRFGF